MVSMGRLAALCVCILGWGVSLAAASQTELSQETTEPTAGPWLGPEGENLPFRTDAEVLSFLRAGRILSQEVLESGSTRPLKVRLEAQGVEAHAIVRHVDVRRKRVKVDGEIHYNFRDSHTYECAAYELSQILGIDNVPPCTTRQLGDRQGTVQLWIEESVTERQRRELQQSPRAPMRWAREKQIMRLFDALINNIDRNQGNMLIDSQGKLWFIDHTRSFGVSREISTLKKIVWCERRVWQRLKALDVDTLAPLAPYLSKDQLRSLLARRDQLQNHLQRRIKKLGEDAVLFKAGTVQKVLADRQVAEGDDDFPANTSLPDLDG